MSFTVNESALNGVNFPGEAPIQSIEVKDFMAFEYGRLDFDNTLIHNPTTNEDGSIAIPAINDIGNVIRITGDNNAGKSAFLTGLRCLALYSNGRMQKKWIRNGADSFVVSVSFEDGVRIQYQKYAKGTSAYDMYFKEDLVFTTRISESKMSPINAVPPVIESYLNLLVMDDNTSFSFVSAIDKQPFVETSAGDNYRYQNRIADTSSLVQAISILNRDVLELQSEVKLKSHDMTVAVAEAESLAMLDDDVLSAVESVVSSYSQAVSAVSALESAESSAQSLNVLADSRHDSLPTVDSALLQAVSSAEDSAQSLLNLADSAHETIPTVDSAFLGSVSSALDSAQSLVALEDSTHDPLPTVDSALLSAVSSAEYSTQSLTALEDSTHDPLPVLDFSTVNDIVAVGQLVAGLASAESSLHPLIPVLDSSAVQGVALVESTVSQVQAVVNSEASVVESQRRLVEAQATLGAVTSELLSAGLDSHVCPSCSYVDVFEVA